MNINEAQAKIAEANRLVIEVHEAIKSNNDKNRSLRLIRLDVADTRNQLSKLITRTNTVQDNA
jgi:hypothetical protein